MSKIKVMYVNPSNKECGIYQYGMRVYKSLEQWLHKWSDWELVYVENYTDVQKHINDINEHKPDVILYSYHPTATPFADGYMGNADKDILHIGITHEQEQCIIDNPASPHNWYGGSLFPYWIGHDPTIVINRDNCFNATRPILRSQWREKSGDDKRITFGNSGFGFRRKLHADITKSIIAEFDEAVIRFNMPPSHFGDKQLHEASQIAEECRRIVSNSGKRGIELRVTHNLLETEEEIVDWLYDNDVNIYFFEQQHVPSHMRGVSSSPDNALSTRRPLIVNRCSMMRHLNPIFGAYGVDGNIKELLERQQRYNTPQLVYNEWSAERTAGEYYNIIRNILNKK
jgi:hypothetical protein